MMIHGHHAGDTIGNDERKPPGILIDIYAIFTGGFHKSPGTKQNIGTEKIRKEYTRQVIKSHKLT
jgi:hypothetical protein